jgi:hypothetical protein
MVLSSVPESVRAALKHHLGRVMAQPVGEVPVSPDRRRRW